MEDVEYKKLSVEELVVHKLWNVRVHGYEEVTKLFRQIDDEKSPEFGKYLGLVSKFVVDNNAIGQEKGLEATLAYVENYAHGGKTVGEVMCGIVAKCIAAPRIKTRELAVQLTLMYVEVEKQDAVLKELLKGMELKNPKIVAACVSISALALRDFGSKVVTVKPLIKKMPVLLSDRDKTVRDETKALVVEIYRWIGNALRPHLTELQPVQLAELETEFAKVSGRVQPTRYLRSQLRRQRQLQEEAKAKAAEATLTLTPTAATSAVDVLSQDLDPYELLDPVNILTKLPDDFYEKVEAKKWRDRLKALEAVEKLLQAPKLKSGDYDDLVRALVKIVSKDSNVMVIAIAGKCLAALANGLMKRFQQYARICVPVLLEKLRDRKQNVLAAIREALDAIFSSTSLEVIKDDVLEALNSKNPTVKAETAAFLVRSFTRSQPAAFNKKLLKAYTGALLKTFNEADPTVRYHSADALGTLMKLVGDKAIAPFLADQDNFKMVRIKECCDKAVIVGKAPRSAIVPSTSAKKPTSAPVASNNPAVAVDHLDNTPLLVDNNLKQQRVCDERWNLTQPSDVLVEQLKKQMATARVRNDLMACMFEGGGNPRQAFEHLTTDLATNIAGLIANLDLVVRWVVLCCLGDGVERSVLTSALEYLLVTLNALADRHYRLEEDEAAMLLAALIHRLADTDSEDVMKVLVQMATVYPSNRVCTALVVQMCEEAGASSLPSLSPEHRYRVRIGCVRTVAALMGRWGGSGNDDHWACLYSDLLRLAQLLSQPEEPPELRHAVFECLSHAHRIQGDHLYDQIGKHHLHPPPPALKHALAGVSESGLHADVLSAAVARVSEAQLPLVVAAVEQLVTSLRTQPQLWSPHLEDSFMAAVATQLRLLAPRDLSESDVLPTYRALLIAIAAFYNTNTLGTKISTNVLNYTMYQLIKLLVHNKLGHIESGAYNHHIERQCVKIIKHADHTNITCALIRLLRQYECTMSKFRELCLLAVWCVLQDVPTWPLMSVNLDTVLYECHLLLEQWPSYASCNVIWTLVYRLAHIPADKHDIIRRGTIPEHSPLYTLLLDIVTAPQPHSQPISRQTKQTLLTIFEKIRSGCQEEAFSLLHDWMQKHPDTDIEPYLQHTSPAYRQFIAQGLAAATLMTTPTRRFIVQL